jgi:hypothetical protein
MRNVGRKLAFVLAASNHGTMIINRFDYRMTGPDSGVGVGYQLLEAGSSNPVDVELALQLLEARRRVHGDGVVAIDGGANRSPYHRMGDRDDGLGLSRSRLRNASTMHWPEISRSTMRSTP